MATADHPTVSSNPALAIVPTYLRSDEDMDKLLRCLVSMRTTEPGLRALVVDDHSPNRQLAAAAKVAADELGMEFIGAEVNRGFASTVNVGLRVARDEGHDGLLVNADIEFLWDGWLQALQSRTDTTGQPAAVVGARLLFPDRTIQHGGIYYSVLTTGFFHRFRHAPANLPEALKPTRCPVTAALQLIRHDCLEAVGIYDEGFGMAFEDVDYCLRVFEAGRECIYEPAALALHLEMAFRGNADERIDAMHEQSLSQLLRRHADTDLSPWIPNIR